MSGGWVTARCFQRLGALLGLELPSILNIFASRNARTRIFSEGLESLESHHSEVRNTPEIYLYTSKFVMF